MVLPALRKKVKELTLAVAKEKRKNATGDQQISISAWKMQQNKKKREQRDQRDQRGDQRNP